MKKSFLSYIGLAATFAASMLLSSCSDDDSSSTKTLTIYPASTKSYMYAEDGEAYMKWKAGDLVYLYNMTQDKCITYSIKADKDGDDAAFTGTAYANKGDKIAVVYPNLSNGTDTLGTDGLLMFDLANQDGTVKTLGNVWYKYGWATVTSASDGVATAYFDSEPVSLMGAIKFSFTNGGSALDNVTRVCISDIPTAGEIDVTYSPEDATLDLGYFETGFMDFYGKFDDGAYAGLFAGSYSATFYVTADGKLYEGSATVSPSVGTLKEQTVELDEVSSSSYVTVGGVKWSSENFSLDSQTLFNWGVVGDAVTDTEAYAAAPSATQIQGGLFSDSAASTKLVSYHRSEYGDVVYWATKGKYRMPSYNDWYSVAPTAASVNQGVEGITSTWTSDGMKITEDATGNSITLPACGYSQRGGDVVNSGTAGYYMTGLSVLASKAWLLYFDSTGDIYLTDSEAGGDPQATRKFRASSIRPVVVE
ncbi:MAG: hypothetical protein K5984_00640 [Bacteroidales bacterium]|nr:hypothetical protein [Bacteroidales bacterium]